MFHALWQDLRYGMRMLVKNPGFTTVAVASLALGIGANTAIFTLIDAVMLKALPVESPEQLVLFDDGPSEGELTGNQTGRWRLFSYPLYLYLRNHSRFFQGLCAFRSGEDGLSVRFEGSPSGEPAHEASGHLVSGNYFSVMGVNAVLGRVLTPEDDVAGAYPAAVISYGYWRQRFNRDPSAIGRAVDLNGTPFTIVGVTPREFFGVRVRRAPDFWLPLTMQPQITLRRSFLDDRERHWINLLGRLKPGAGIEQVQAFVNVQLRQFLTLRDAKYNTAREAPPRMIYLPILQTEGESVYPSNLEIRTAGETLSAVVDVRKAIADVDSRLPVANVTTLNIQVDESLRQERVIAQLSGLFGLLALLLACVGLYGVMVNAVARRTNEIGIRMALGAGHGEILWMVLRESLVLVLAGVAIGIPAALATARLISSQLFGLKPSDPLAISIATTFLISVAALAGYLPARRASRVDPMEALRYE